MQSKQKSNHLCDIEGFLVLWTQFVDAVFDQILTQPNQLAPNTILLRNLKQRKPATSAIVLDLAKSFASVYIQRSLGLRILGLHLGGHDMQDGAHVESPRLAILHQTKLVFGRNASNVVQGCQVFFVDTFPSPENTGSGHLHSASNPPTSHPFLNPNLLVHVACLRVDPSRRWSGHTGVHSALIHARKRGMGARLIRTPSSNCHTSH